jgi:hypothetical protein
MKVIGNTKDDKLLVEMKKEELMGLLGVVSDKDKMFSGFNMSFDDVLQGNYYNSIAHSNQVKQAIDTISSMQKTLQRFGETIPVFQRFADMMLENKKS